MAKYRKKPVVVEAVQWTGYNDSEVEQFTGYGVAHHSKMLNSAELSPWASVGQLDIYIGAYIVRDADGKLTRCAPEIFEKNYEVVEEDA